MQSREITSQALRMAWKMVDTIFPRYRVPVKERNALLTAVTGIALDDLLRAGSLSWRKALPSNTLLMFERHGIWLKPSEKSRLALRPELSADDLDRSVEWVEETFDKYGLSEEERATLYTALPCVGLHALNDYIAWAIEPPFPELGD
jgi:hypothetical protein